MDGKENNGGTRRIVVAITGATGAIFGIRALERLHEFDVESHLIISKWARKTIAHETPYRPRDVEKVAHVIHNPSNQAAPIASGSFVTHGMLIAPCSMKTMAAVSTGLSDALILRAADVILKERRRLVIMPRESPIHEVHLENMLRLARMGVVIVPPVPAFYTRPKSVDDVVDHIVTRLLDQMGLHSDTTPRWDGQLRGEP